MKHPEVLLLISSFPTARFLGISRFARERGWNLTLEEKQFPPTSWNWDGALVMLEPENSALRHFVKGLLQRSVPVVDLVWASPKANLPRVCGDNTKMGILAAQHFHERGLKRLAWFSQCWGNVQKQRFDGLAASKLFVDPPLRLVGSELAHGKSDYREALVKALLTLPKPIGIFAYSDYGATRVLNACRAAGLAVPEEVAILGVDDNALICENQAVSLSSIRHPHEQIGYLGAALLDRLMSGERPPAKPTLVAPLGITIRQSTDVVAAEDPLVRQALVIIRRDLSSSFGTPEIARELDVRTSVLTKAFLKEIGRTPSKEIIRQRLLRAKALISEHKLKLEMVAAETGFCSAAHLSNAFKSAFGMNPRTYYANAVT